MVKIDNKYNVECIKVGDGFIYKFNNDNNYFNVYVSLNSPIDFKEEDLWYNKLKNIIGECDLEKYCEEHFINYDDDLMDLIIEAYAIDIIIQLENEL